MELFPNTRCATAVRYVALIQLFLFGFVIASFAYAQKQNSFTVGVTLKAFVDQGRSNWQGTGPRPLQTIVWYPAAIGSRMKAPDFGSPELKKYFVSYPLALDAAISGNQQRYPLVVFSHGSTSSALALEWLGFYLASHGYIVAAVNHHGDTAAEPSGPIPQRFAQWERPKDISVLIDKMLADPFFGPHIDAERIGAAGHSAGGATVLELTGAIFDPDQIQAFCAGNRQSDPNCDPPADISNQLQKFVEMTKTDPVVEASFRRSHLPYDDRRIKAVFAMAPAIGVGHTDASLRAIGTPVYIVGGRADDITPLPTNAERFGNLISSATLMVLPGMVGHATFGSLCTPEGVRDKGWVCHDEVGVNRTQVHSLVEQLALSFFQSALTPK